MGDARKSKVTQEKKELVSARANEAENKAVFAELLSLYGREMEKYNVAFEKTTGNSRFYGWTWWSLPTKMWRTAKALGFEKIDYRWRYCMSQTGDYTGSYHAKSYAIKRLLEKYPASLLLQNISCERVVD